MPVVHESISIGRSKQAVWPFLVEPAKLLMWQSRVVELSGEWEGAPEPGDRATAAMRFAGRKVEFQTEFTVLDPPERVEFKSAKAPFPFVVRVRLEDEDGGTHVTFHAETESLWGFFGWLGDEIVSQMYARDVRANLQTLKALLEEADTIP